MLKRKLQVSPSTFTLKNPVRDKWAQQSHPSEDSSSCARPADAAHDPWTRPAACGKVLKVTPLVLFADACLVICILFSHSQPFLLRRALAQILVSVMAHT